MRNKKFIIVGFILVVASITIGILILNTVRPKHTSKELFVRANKDLANFGFELSEYMTDMSDIMQNDLNTIINMDNNTIDLSKSTKFKKVKENINDSCNKIINYDNVGLSKEMNDYLEYAKGVATETVKYFNDIDKELSQDEYTKLLNTYTSHFSDEMNELTNLNAVACLAYYNEISEDKKTLADFQNDISKNREEKSSNISSNNKSNSTIKTTSFTNKYGSATTMCAHYGCSNYIAPTGDTNCCTIHSRKCGNCGKYIDEDALFCMDCLEKAIKNLK